MASLFRSKTAAWGHKYLESGHDQRRSRHLRRLRLKIPNNPIAAIFVGMTWANADAFLKPVCGAFGTLLLARLQFQQCVKWGLLV